MEEEKFRQEITRSMPIIYLHSYTKKRTIASTYETLGDQQITHKLDLTLNGGEIIP